MLCECGARNVLSYIFRRIVGTCIILFFVVGVTSFATSPPADNVSYRGDSDGNFLIDLIDVNITRDLSLLKCVDHSTVVPSDPCEGDVHDLNGDAIVDLIDINVHKDLSLLKSYAIPDAPWTLDTSSLPSSITVGSPGALQVAITNALSIGRPGIVVRFSVVNGTGSAELSGREYNPVDDGIRDHASPAGATSVLAITKTDFVGDQSGLTETIIPNVLTPVEVTGTSAGTVTLNVDVLPDALKGIPALSASIPLTVSAVGTPPTINDCTGAVSVDELTAYSCAISVTEPDGDPVTLAVDGGTDTCGGSIVGGDYQFTPGEDKDPSCVIGVTATDKDGSDSFSETLTVNEVNTLPVVAVTCGAAVNEGSAINCTYTSSDSDIVGGLPQTLTDSVGASNTCGGSPVVGGGSYSVTAAEDDDPSCIVAVSVSDGVGSSEGTDVQVVNEVNLPPVLGSIATPQTSPVGAPLSFDAGIGTTDPDLPAQTLTYSLSFDSCPEGSINSVTGVYANPATVIQTCQVIVRVTDSGGLFAEQLVDIDIFPYADTDGDGIADWLEILAGLDPALADSDGDGISDGEEITIGADGYITNPFLVDTDGDTIGDGVETGVPGYDADPKKTTDPTSIDTDGGTISDGDEDLNKNGKKDPGEKDPLKVKDDVPGVDSDGDKLSDALEILLGLDPFNNDSDGDGIRDDRDRKNMLIDSDGDTLIDALDTDSDNDGLLDGQEDLDGDGKLDGGETLPYDADTDNGGTDDYTELMINGTDPRDCTDDDPAGTDSDCDGLLDIDEITTDLLNPDSDGDGMLDGAEVMWGLDPLVDDANEDPDGDGMSNLIEVGPGGTGTNPFAADTDAGGTNDGKEVIIDGTDPLNSLDDIP